MTTLKYMRLSHMILAVFMAVSLVTISGAITLGVSANTQVSKLVEVSPSPTPSPTPLPSPTPTPTPVPTIEPTPEPTIAPTAEPTLVPKKLVPAPSPQQLPFTNTSKVVEVGQASYYTIASSSNKTASGEPFVESALTIAHKYLAFGTVANLTNTDNGETVQVRVNDRGPYTQGRIVDMSPATKSAIHCNDVCNVRLETL